jgi:hypothetical protein
MFTVCRIVPRVEISRNGFAVAPYDNTYSMTPEELNDLDLVVRVTDDLDPSDLDWYARHPETEPEPAPVPTTDDPEIDDIRDDDDDLGPDDEWFLPAFEPGPTPDDLDYAFAVELAPIRGGAPEGPTDRDWDDYHAWSVAQDRLESSGLITDEDVALVGACG